MSHNLPNESKDHNRDRTPLMIFARKRAEAVRFPEMSPSPFHGIFASLGSSLQDDGSLSAPTEENQVSEAKITGKGQIAVDIYEQDNYYIIRAPLAGVKLGDLDIEVDDKVLTITGRRTPPEQIAADQYYLQECFWGEFSRSITLPCIIDPKRVKATFNRDAILKILIPKEEKVKIVRISEGN